MIAEVVAAAAQEGNAATGTIIAALGAGGLGAILAAIVTGMFSKRKLGAEATEIITNAAAGVVTSMEAQLARSEKARQADQSAHEIEMARITHEHAIAMTRMAEAHVKERDAWTKVLQLHVAWDALAISKLAELDMEMPNPPPLTPAQRFVDEHGYPVEEVN